MPSKVAQTPKQEDGWEQAKIFVANQRGRDPSAFSKQDWGLVNHVYKRRKKGHYFPDLGGDWEPEVIDRVASASYWTVMAGQIKEQLFDLYDNFNSLVNTKKAASPGTSLETIFVKAYAELQDKRGHGGLLKDDEEAFKEFVEGYTEFYG